MGLGGKEGGGGRGGLLTRPDPSRETPTPPDPTPLDPRGFDNLLARSAGRVMTREKALEKIDISPINLIYRLDLKNTFSPQVLPSS